MGEFDARAWFDIVENLAVDQLLRKALLTSLFMHLLNRAEGSAYTRPRDGNTGIFSKCHVTPR